MSFRKLIDCSDLHKTVCNTDMHIVIYGAGDYGQTLYKYLLSIGICGEKLELAVTAIEHQKSTGFSHIRLIEECLEEKNDIVVIVASEKYMVEMCDELSCRGFNDAVVMTQNLYSEIKLKNSYIDYTILQANLMRLQPQPRYQYFVVNILSHCNLRCKGCDHFACIASPYFVELDVIKKELQRLSQLTEGKITQVAIMGGEPLLHPELHEILKTTRKYFPHTIIRLTTNGILLPSRKQDFWDLCRQEDVTIVNTKYPLKIDYRKIEETAKENNVKFMYFEGTNGNVVKKSYKKTIDVQGVQNPTLNFMNCDLANYGNFLMEGKIYGCPFAGCIHIFNERFGYNLEVEEKDYLDIYEESMTYERMLEFAATPHPFCRYCYLGRREYGLDWERSKQDKYEWLPLEPPLA